MTKPNLAYRLKMARQSAEAYLREHSYTSLPIDPFEIAAKHDIEVKAKPDTAGGVSGMLLRHGDNFGILYATHTGSEGFERFSVGHELGHYLLEGHIDHVLPNGGIHTSHAGFVSTDPYELEADHYSSGLLMPSGPFRQALNRRRPGLGSIEFMAGLCKTSLTATAIRCAELSNDAVAVVISTGNAIDFCFLSEAMKSLPQLSWLKKGTPIPKGTVTAQLSADPDAVLKGERLDNELDVLDWLGGSKSAIVTEEVVGLGRYGKTLTVLSSETIGRESEDDDDDESDDDLAERWTPRFRR
jgi:Zn-dependent peptidase ImmA (M78 family)